MTTWQRCTFVVISFTVGSTVISSYHSECSQSYRENVLIRTDMLTMYKKLCHRLDGYRKKCRARSKCGNIRVRIRIRVRVTVQLSR